MIDYGSSLPRSDIKTDFKYPWEDEPVDAVFFTHYHGDHTGRLMEIPDGIPIYIGATARQVMINIHEALGSSKNIDDALVIEGTMMSRSMEAVISEPEMQMKAAEYLHEHKYAFLICSSTNLDSLASFHQAAQMTDRRYGRHMYVYSEYFRKQLELFTKTAGSFTDVYKFEKVAKLSDMSNIPPGQKRTPPMTQREMMEEFGFLAVIKPEEFCEEYIDLFVDLCKDKRKNDMPVLIYSMWDGYIQEYRRDKNGNKVVNKAKNDAWIEFLKRVEDMGVHVEHMHTSGHATTKMLAEVINAVDPQDKIFPMHTECADDFMELPIRDGLKDRIIIEKE